MNLMESIVRRLYRLVVPGAAKNYLALHQLLIEQHGEPRLIAHPPGRKIVVLAPHMDDETIGCGGTLHKQILAGAEVVIVFLTDGRWGGPSPDGPAPTPPADWVGTGEKLVAVRKREAAKAARIIGIDNLLFLDQPDMELTATAAVVGALREIIEEYTPDLVYLPFITDRNRDHWQTNHIFIEAMMSLPHQFRSLSCCAYEVWSPLYPNAVVDVGSTVEVKKRALEKYESQLWHHDFVHTALGLNAYRSISHLNGRGYAEAFFVDDFDAYHYLYRKIQL